LFLVQACSSKNGIDSDYYCEKFKLSCIQSNKVIYFKTSKGDFEVKLFLNLFTAGRIFDVMHKGSQ